MVTPRARHAAAVVGGYTAISVVFLWRGVVDFMTRYIADTGDGAAFLWSWWHVPRAISAGDSPFATDGIFWPIGARLAFHTMTPLEAVMAWPLRGIVGDVVAVNLLQLGAVIATGAAAYLLARHVCDDRRAAFVAGAAFMLCPQHILRVAGHWNFNHLWVLPLALLALLRLYERPAPGRAALLGLATGGLLLTDFTQLLFFLIAAALIALWRWRETFTAALVLSGVLAGVVAFVVGAPLIISAIGDLASGELRGERGWGTAVDHSADLVAWFAPWHVHPLWGGLTSGADDRMFGSEAYPYVGLAIVSLAIFAVAIRARVGPWPLVAGAFAVLSLGPFLRVNGWAGSVFELRDTEFAVPLPYLGVLAAPVLSAARIPGRFSIVAILALAVLASVGLAAVLRTVRPRVSWAVAAGVLAIVIVEVLPPPTIRTLDADAPPAYEAIARSRDRGAVLEIPIAWRDGLGQVGDAGNRDVVLFYATAHGRPVVNGMAARLAPDRWEALQRIPVYRQVLALQGANGFTDPPTFTAANLRALGIGFVVHHRSVPTPGATAYIESLQLHRLADDGDTIVWAVPPA